MVILFPDASFKQAKKFFSASKYKGHRLHALYGLMVDLWALRPKHDSYPFTYFPADKTLWLDESGEVQWIKY